MNDGIINFESDVLTNFFTNEINNLCELTEVQDYLLFSPGEIVTGSGTAYRVYTPFLRKTEKKAENLKFSQASHV